MTAHHCPLDGTSLDLRHAGPARFWVCGECSGVWVQAEELERFVAEPQDTRNLPLEVGREEPGASERAALECPCGRGVSMRAVGPRGVEIDLCPECRAIWLDAGELAALLRGVRPGKRLPGGFQVVGSARPGLEKGVNLVEVLAEWLSVVF